MVEFGLVGLYLTEVAIVEIATIPQISVAEDDHASTSVTHSQILTRFVETEGCENVSHCDTSRVALT